MSSTKILIVVLILIALLFVIFVVRGGFRDDKQTDRTNWSKEAPWTKTIEDVFSSLKPKVELKRKCYSSSIEEDIAPDEYLQSASMLQRLRGKPFRTATFHLLRGSASIKYEDRTEDAIDKLKEQEFELPDPDRDDKNQCSIVVLKKGGKLTFSCKGTNPCKVYVTDNPKDCN
jgi:hypothetical protein